MTVSQDDIVLRAEKIGIRYQHLKQRGGRVLSDVSFDLKQGETLGVIGRNGAGKSSLLRVLAGIVYPDTGRIIRSPNTRASLLSINLSFEPYLGLQENAILLSMVLGLTYTEAKKKLPEIIEFSELDVDPSQKVGTFSSGMRARLALSIALSTTPEIMLIDELLSVGDGFFRDKSAMAIRNIASTNRSVVLVTHNMMAIRKLCNRVLWVENGTQQAIGETVHVLNEYEAFLNASQSK